MIEGLVHWFQHGLDPAVPLLPAVALMQASLCLSWGIVLACLAVLLLGAQLGRAPALWGVPLLMAVWPWLPGTLSASYWLGLAFQAPSVSAVLLSLLVVRARWKHPNERGVCGPWVGSPLAWMTVLLGVLLGWALLLDTLALLPVQMYAWGFSPPATVLAVLLGLVPWVVLPNTRGSGVLAGLVPLAVALFVALRLPSGNLWDAVLDPWLWLVLQFLLLRKIFFSVKHARRATQARAKPVA